MTDEELRKAQMKDQYRQQQAAGESLAAASPQGQAGGGMAYTPSAVVSQAQSYLSGLKSGQAKEFESPYTGQIAALYDRIMNRPKFSYDANKDPLFQAYKNQYVRQGQRAMQDTVGQSAALTGGYGNTWAATAGSQAYQDYLTRMTAMLPELEGRAYERYAGEGEQLQNQLSLASAMENQDYERFRDALSDWMANQKSGGGSTPKKTTEDTTDKLYYIDNPQYKEGSPYVKKFGPYTAQEYSDLLDQLKAVDKKIKGNEQGNESAAARATETIRNRYKNNNSGSKITNETYDWLNAKKK